MSLIIPRFPPSGKEFRRSPKAAFYGIRLFSCHGIIYMHGVPSYSCQLRLKMIYFSKHFNSQQSGKPELSSFFKGGIIMTEVQYSNASFLHSALKPSEQLVYMTSAAFGKNWAYTLHSHSFAEVFFVTSGKVYSIPTMRRFQSGRIRWC